MQKLLLLNPEENSPSQILSTHLNETKDSDRLNGAWLSLSTICCTSPILKCKNELKDFWIK